MTASVCSKTHILSAPVEVDALFQQGPPVGELLVEVSPGLGQRVRHRVVHVHLGPVGVSLNVKVLQQPLDLFLFGLRSKGRMEIRK